jgi:hypothetical protein
MRLPRRLRWRHRPADYTPQLDAPLWRGTDLPDPDGPAPTESLAGSIMALGYATDETSARYWLAQCARRGADWPLLRQLWRAWEADQARNVHRIHTHSEETNP